MRRYVTAFACLIFLLPLACNNDDENGPDETPDAVAVLREAADAAAGLESFRFRFTHENGTTPLPMNLRLERAEGQVMVPSRLSAEVRARAAGNIGVTVDLVAIENDTWVTNPFTRRWQRLANTSLNEFADPAALVTILLPEIQDPRITGRERIDGAQSYRIEGEIDSESLREALGFARPGQVVSVETWIGVDDSLPRRVRLTGRLTSEDAENVVRQIDLSDFNAPVDIQPPA